MHRDHPRGRGEHRGTVVFAGPGVGPSPRARGALMTESDSVEVVRTIPAGAGSTERPPRHTCRGQDHPRGRGEHPRQFLRRSIRQGPSPRARGARRLRTRTRQRPGTIPAGAGSTLVDQGVYRGEARGSFTSCESDIADVIPLSNDFRNGGAWIPCSSRVVGVAWWRRARRGGGSG